MGNELAFYNLRCQRCNKSINLFTNKDEIDGKRHNCGKGRNGIVAITKCNYYDILEIEPGCDIKDIKEAYRKMCLKYHPDINKSSFANEEFIQVMNAYSVLADDGMRNDYDLEVGVGFESNIDLRMLEYIMKRDPENRFIMSLYMQYLDWGHLTKRQRDALKNTYINMRRFWD